MIEFEEIGDDPNTLKLAVLLAIRDHLQQWGNPLPLEDLINGRRPSEAFRIRGAINEMEIRGLVRQGRTLLNLAGDPIDGGKPRVGITDKGLAWLDEWQDQLRQSRPGPAGRRAGFI